MFVNIERWMPRSGTLSGAFRVPSALSSDVSAGAAAAPADTSASGGDSAARSADAASPSASTKARTSPSITRPPLPEPSTRSRSTSSSLATRRTAGAARIFFLRPVPLSAVAPFACTPDASAASPLSEARTRGPPLLLA